MTRRPFASLPEAVVWLPEAPPDPYDPISQFCQLLIDEHGELAAELGCPVTFGADLERMPDPEFGECYIGPSSRNPVMRSAMAVAGRPVPTGPVLWIDRARRQVGVDGLTLEDVGSAFQWLRTCVRLGVATCTPTVPDSVEAMLELIEREVAETYPSFDLRGISWPHLLDQHRAAIVASDGSLPALQRLFAGLEDAHTWVRDPALNARAPYRVWVEGERAHLVHVPAWSAAAQAGVQAGDTLLGLDLRDWWERTSATPRSRPLVSGFRALMGTVGDARQFRARGRNGREITWVERYQPLPYAVPMSWEVRPSGTGYLRIRGWSMSSLWFNALDTAFDGLAGCPRMIVDLRGNIGGQLIAAHRFRERFLERSTGLGKVRFSIGGGALGDPVPIHGAPTPGDRAWHKPVRFLIDRQTYSASEDAILGLGGLPHVQIVGEPSGGGSGRPRSLPLGNGLLATISTALTYDHDGRCIEAHGLAVDIPLPIEAHFRDPVAIPASAIVDLADTGW